MIKQEQSKAVAVPCGEFGCRLPAARIERGCLIITSRHRGEHHPTALSLEWVRQQLAQAEAELTASKQPDAR